MPAKKSAYQSSQRGWSQHVDRMTEKKIQLKAKKSKFAAAIKRSKMKSGRSAYPGGRSGPSLCMTPEELCRYDDICTGLIIDPYMGFQTHKMNIRFRPLSKQPELKKIVEDFIEDQDYDRAHDRLLSIDQRRIAPLVRTEREQSLMRQHIFCFLKMFDKEAGFQIKPCERYSAEENQGGKIVATKSWKKNEYISMLVGCIGELTPQQEKDLLVCGQNDFSVMWSNRKKKSQLWLGPAAYMNHDCKPNCRFIPVGNTAYLQVIRDISPGDEILLSYGDNFFGPDNCSCECNTCEMTKRGAFKLKEDEVVEEHSNRLRQIPSRIGTRAERATANGTAVTADHKDNWNGRMQRLRANADLLNGEELKKRKLTKYDAQIIMEGNQLLPQVFHSPTVRLHKTLPPHHSTVKEEPSPDDGKAAQGSDICRESASQDNSSLAGLAPGHMGKKSCTAANPCVSRGQGKRFMGRCSKARLRQCAKIEEEDPAQTDHKPWAAEDTEKAPTALVPKLCENGDLNMADNCDTVHCAHLSPNTNSSSVHCDMYSLCSSKQQHLNGKLSLKNKTLNKEALVLRHSPRLRLRHCSGQEDGCEFSAVTDSACIVNEAEALGLGGGDPGIDHFPVAVDEDNEDSGLGEMTGDGCDKSLDSNHNFHEPPVLEPQLPYVSASPPAPGYHGGDGDSDQELNKSSGSVPSLSFWGPEPLSVSDSPKPSQKKGKKRKYKASKDYKEHDTQRNVRITRLCIKLSHPDNDKKADFYQRLERDGKSRFVKIEPKERHNSRQSSGGSGVTEKTEPRDVDSAQTSKECVEGQRSGHVAGRPSSSQTSGPSSQRYSSQPALPPVKLKLQREVWQSVA